MTPRYAAAPRLGVVIGADPDAEQVGADDGSPAADPGADADRSEAEEDVFVCVLPDGLPLALSGTAGRIFLAARDGAGLDELVQRLADWYDVAPEVLAEDVRGFLDGMVSAGVLVRSDASAEDEGAGT